MTSGPGVTITTLTRTGPGATDVPDTATLFVVGQTEKGPLNAPVLVRTMTEFVANYGGYVSYGYAYDVVKSFLEDQGGRCYMQRVAGATPVVSFLMLVDRAGSPVNTLKIVALNAGAWGNAYKVAVANGTPANTFTITVTDLAGNVLETFADLATPAAAVVALAASLYVRAVDQASVTAAPNNNPAVLAAAALAAGTDDRGTVNTASYTAGLALFGADLGSGAVAVPGQPSSGVGAALKAHAIANNRLALLSVAAASTLAQAITAAGALVGAGGEYMVLVWPWVVITDGSTLRTIPPEGYAAAARARAHKQFGPWRVPAGFLSASGYLSDIETHLTPDQGRQADAGQVSPIRFVDGAIELYGWRSLSSDAANYRYGNGRDTLNAASVALLRRLERYVFETNDALGHLLSKVVAEGVDILEPWKRAGGLWPIVNAETGATISPAYLINVGSDINTPATLAADELHVDLGLRLSPTAAAIFGRVIKAGLTAHL